MLVRSPSPQVSNRSATVEGFERWTSTYFSALFAGGLFDQVLLPEVAAGVDWTGRIRYSPFRRAGRTAASDQLVLWGDAAARDGEFARLKDLHRAIHGTSSDGVRFSALAPEPWNWILISTTLMYIKSYQAVCGQHLSDADLQALWEHVTQNFEGLQLRGSNRLPEHYDDVVAYYEETIATKGERTDIFAHVNKHLDVLRLLPLRPVAILSIGITHPGVREIAGHRWTRRRQLEFALYCAAIRIAYTRLPRRLVTTPLAYHRWKCEQLEAQYQAAGLTSFAPEGRCPIGR